MALIAMFSYLFNSFVVYQAVAEKSHQVRKNKFATSGISDVTVAFFYTCITVQVWSVFHCSVHTNEISPCLLPRKQESVTTERIIELNVRSRFFLQSSVPASHKARNNLFVCCC